MILSFRQSGAEVTVVGGTAGVGMASFTHGSEVPMPVRAHSGID
jgi:hypothetical protein